MPSSSCLLLPPTGGSIPVPSCPHSPIHKKKSEKEEDQLSFSADWDSSRGRGKEEGKIRFSLEEKSLSFLLI